MKTSLNTLEQNSEIASCSKRGPLLKFPAGYSKTLSLWNQNGLLKRIQSVVTAFLETVRNMFVLVPNLCISLINRAHLVFEQKSGPFAPPLPEPEILTKTAEEAPLVLPEPPTETQALPETPQPSTTQQLKEQRQSVLDLPITQPILTETASTLIPPQSKPSYLVKLATTISDIAKRHPITVRVAAVCLIAAIVYLGAPASLFGSAASNFVDSTMEAAKIGTGLNPAILPSNTTDLNALDLFGTYTSTGQNLTVCLPEVDGSSPPRPLMKVVEWLTGICNNTATLSTASSSHLFVPFTNTTDSNAFNSPGGFCPSATRTSIADQMEVGTCSALTRPISTSLSNEFCDLSRPANDKPFTNNTATLSTASSSHPFVPFANTTGSNGFNNPPGGFCPSATKTSIADQMELETCPAPTRPTLTSLSNEPCDLSSPATDKQFIKDFKITPNVNNHQNSKSESFGQSILESILALSALVFGLAYARGGDKKKPQSNRIKTIVKSRRKQPTENNNSKHHSSNQPHSKPLPNSKADSAAPQVLPQKPPGQIQNFTGSNQSNPTQANNTPKTPSLNPQQSKGGLSSDANSPSSLKQPSASPQNNNSTTTEKTSPSPAKNIANFQKTQKQKEKSHNSKLRQQEQYKKRKGISLTQSQLPPSSISSNTNTPPNPKEPSPAANTPVSSPRLNAVVSPALSAHVSPAANTPVSTPRSNILAEEQYLDRRKKRSKDVLYNKTPILMPLKKQRESKTNISTLSSRSPDSSSVPNSTRKSPSSPSDYDSLTTSPSLGISLKTSFQTPPRQVQAQRKEPNESNRREETLVTEKPKLPASPQFPALPPSASPQQKDDPNWNPLGLMSSYTPFSHKLSRQKEKE